ncbi:hypothetical protein JCGZ_21506 [Jatropha curcas]|uniref:LOB domain-containing protein n=1 Tax=Jatropha curcas TaxID=180498 RepID=A0A067JM05_JATCU|nr:hypothetical protein JCGZ_21506 [Jatropha curcas]
MSGESGAGESSNRHGCAACKHQRRKCNDNCLLKPCFGLERIEEFQAAQRVFGISNLNKMIKSLQAQDRHKAIESVIWEASIWKKDPINGPLGQYRKLEQENQFLKNQLIQQQQKQIMSYPGRLGLQGFNNGVIQQNCDFPANYSYSYSYDENIGTDLPMNNFSAVSNLWSSYLQGQDNTTLGRNIPILQANNFSSKQEALSPINGPIGLRVPSLLQTSSQIACNNQGRGFLYEHGQGNLDNPNFVQSKNILNQTGDLVLGKAATKLHRIKGRDVRYAPYLHNSQFNIQKHDIMRRSENNLNVQHVQQLPNPSQQLNGIEGELISQAHSSKMEDPPLEKPTDKGLLTPQQ